MPTIATASTPGFGYYTDGYGNKHVACDCIRKEWLPLLEKMAIKRGIIKTCLDIIQITGGDAASGNTHVWGAAIDFEQVGSAFVALLREAGATASWSRYPPAFTNDHTHAALNGCPHDQYCHYQLVAQQRGYNGLGQGPAGTQYAGQWGYGGKDNFPNPTIRRTWQQGVEWMKTQLAPTGDFDVATVNDVDAKLAAILNEVKGLRSEESGRYKYYSGKFNAAETLQRNLVTNLTALEASLDAKGQVADLEAFKAAAQEAFDAALKSTLSVNVEAKP